MKFNSMLNALISPWSLLIFFFGSSLFFVFHLDIYPFFRDDAIYFNAARQFSECQTVYGNAIINFDHSKIGEFNWYGPGYHLIYGMPSLILGFNEGKTSLLLHVLLWTIAIILVIRNFPEHRLILSILMIASPFYYYHFHFYPVIINTFVTLISFLIMIQLTKGKEKNKFSIILGFIFSIVFGAFLRITHVLSFALLYCRANTKRKFVFVSLSFILIVGLTWLYQTYFCAPMFIAADETINLLGNKDFITFGYIFILNFIRNLIIYFQKIEFQDLQFWITLIISMIAPLFLTKEKLDKIRPVYQGLLFMNISYIAVLFALYNANPFFLNKQLIILLPANFIFIIVYLIQKNSHNKIFLIVNLLFFPFTIVKTTKAIEIGHQCQRAKYDVEMVKNAPDLVFRNIKEEGNKVLNILIDHKAFKSLDEIQYCALFCELPFQSAAGNNLRNVFIIHPNESFSIDERGDYLLSLTKMPESNKLSLISESPGLILYKINKGF